MLEEFDPDALETGKFALLEQLMELAQAQGYLLLDDLMAAMPELEENLSQLEEVFIHCLDQGLEIYSDAREAEEKKKQEVISEDNGHRQAEIDFFADLSDIPADNILSLYLKEMTRVPLLTFAQEVALAKQLEKGRQAEKKLKRAAPNSEETQLLKADLRKGRQARNHLIKANTRLVFSIAKKYMEQGVPLVDLIQEGNLGLMRATTKFDYRRGYKFSTYATWWIRQSVTRALASQGRTVRIPIHMNDRFRRLQQVSNQLEQSWGRRPTPEELAHEMGLAPAKIRWMLQASQHSVSLASPVGEEGETELGDLIKDEEVSPPPDTAQHRFLREKLEEVMLALPPREAKILKLRFGLHDGQSYSLQEIGEKFGLTRERIRQLEQKALHRLRHPSRSRPLKGFLG